MALDFALLGHPSSIAHVRALAGYDTLDMDDDALAAALEAAVPTVLETPLAIEGIQGQRAHGVVILCPFLPEAIQSPRRMLDAYRKTVAACELARDLGVRIAALGGFTSIIAAEGEPFAAHDLILTSGSTLTAALALAQLDGVMALLGGWDAAGTVAVIGASGHIGSACTLALTRRPLRRLVLIGRSRHKLQALRHQLPAALDVSIETAAQAAVEADVIIAATSTAHPLLTTTDLRPGCIVCDIGYPKTIAGPSDPRDDVWVFAGGMARMHFAASAWFQRFAALPAPDVMFGCFSEALVLSLTGQYERANLSTSITPDALESMLSLAQSVGFAPAPPLRRAHPFDLEEFDRFLEAKRRV